MIARDRCCRFPGCRQRPAACQAHHLKPRSHGGATSLSNLILLCAFHHLTAIHRWGWHLALHPDGTTTAISPDKQRILTATDHPPAPPNPRRGRPITLHPDGPRARVDQRLLALNAAICAHT